MAGRTLALIAALVAGGIGLILLLPLLALWFSSADGFRLASADLSAIRFTLLQAALSALCASLLAIPLARALARRQFRGRGALITLLGAPFLLPVVVASLGIATVYGRAGWLNGAVQGLGILPDGLPFQLYGLQGVVLANVFLNLPLAVRILLQGWIAIPAERFRLAQSLSFTPRDIRRHLEWPMLRQVLPGAALVIFTICLSSFVIALTLGGGPRATTVELAIYQALRYEFDLARAASLALVQFGLCAVAFIVLGRLSLNEGFGAGLGRKLELPARRGLQAWGDGVILVLLTLFVLLPLAAVITRGLPGLTSLPPQVWPAALRSLMVALVSAVVSTSLALMLALRAAQIGGRWISWSATLPLAASSLVLGSGLFVLVLPYSRPADWALVVTILVNVLLTLPFAFRILSGPASALEQDCARLARALGLPFMARLRLLILPRMARPLGFAMGLSAAYAMGDLGVIALFATEQSQTLPLVVQLLTSAYRTDAAASAALLLVCCSFALFLLFDRWGRRHAAD